MLTGYWIAQSQGIHMQCLQDSQSPGVVDAMPLLFSFVWRMFCVRPFEMLIWALSLIPLSELETSFGRYGYPAFVALNPKDGKFASLREAFDAPNVDHFVESLRSVSHLIVAP